MKSPEALRSVNARDPASLPAWTALRASLRHLTASRNLGNVRVGRRPSRFDQACA
jgi:hypothetical protein